MGFFQKRKIRRHKRLVLQTAEQVVSEDDRVYRNQLDLFSREFNVQAAPSGIGLYKARLFGTCFPMYAFTLRWSDVEEDWFETLQLLTGLAVEPLVETSAEVAFSVEEARELAPSFMKHQFALIRDEVDSGPSRLGTVGITSSSVEAYAGQFGLSDRRKRELLSRTAQATEEQLTSGFAGLVSTCHEALIDSIGKSNYTTAARRRFESLLKGSVFGRLRLMTQLIQALS